MYQSPDLQSGGIGKWWELVGPSSGIVGMSVELIVKWSCPISLIDTFQEEQEGKGFPSYCAMQFRLLASQTVN